MIINDGQRTIILVHTAKKNNRMDDSWMVRTGQRNVLGWGVSWNAGEMPLLMEALLDNLVVSPLSTNNSHLPGMETDGIMAHTTPLRTCPTGAVNGNEYQTAVPAYHSSSCLVSPLQITCVFQMSMYGYDVYTYLDMHVFIYMLTML